MRSATLAHFFLIPDGDRRYAKRENLPFEEAYRRAADALENIIECVLVDHGIKEFSFFGLSYANIVWRKKEELSSIFQEQERFLRRVPNSNLFNRNRIRLRVHGARELLPESLRTAIDEAEKSTRGYSNRICNLLIAYSGAKDLENAIAKTQNQAKPLTVENIMANSYINTPVDLIVRAAGEFRLSDSPLLATSYSELCSINRFFPELEKEDINTAISEFKRRVRTYGK